MIGAIVVLVFASAVIVAALAIIGHVPYQILKGRLEDWREDRLCAREKTQRLQREEREADQIIEQHDPDLALYLGIGS